MKKKILAFAGSNHSTSINYQLLEFTVSMIQEAEVTLLDLRSWDVPMYSIDLDADPNATPEQITTLIEAIQTHDGFIIASPEHNGATPAFFKTLLRRLMNAVN